MLNTSIKSRETFNQLVAKIFHELSTNISEIKELNKVDDINSELARMYLSTREEACSILRQIQQKFSSHETEFKEKLCSYVRHIRENLETLAKEPYPKIGDLRKKIEELAGKEDGKRGGRFGKLMDAMSTLSEEYSSLTFWQYMNIGRVSKEDMVRYHRTGESVMWFINGAIEHISDMEPTMWKLQKIPDQLNVDNRLQEIIKELEGLSSSNIDTYEKDISRHEAKIQLLNILSQYKRFYEGTLEKTKKALEEIRKIKESINGNKEKFKADFVKEADKMEDIRDDKLDDITKRLEDIIDTVKTTQNFIDNTKLFFGYLNVFKEHKSKIDRLQIQGTNISDIQKTIESIEDAITTITGTVTPIHKSKKGVEDGFRQTWKEGSDRNTEMGGIKKQYFPKDINVFDDWGQIEVHKGKLEAIHRLNGILLGINFSHTLETLKSPTNDTKNVQILLSHLSEIDKAIEGGKHIGADVSLIKTVYNLNKSKLNGTQNGNGIDQMVETIYYIYYIIYTIFIESSGSSKGSRPRSLR